MTICKLLEVIKKLGIVKFEPSQPELTPYLGGFKGGYMGLKISIKIKQVFKIHKWEV